MVSEDDIRKQAMLDDLDASLAAYDSGHDPFAMVPAPPPAEVPAAAPAPAIRPQVDPLPPARKALAAARTPAPPAEAPQGSSSMPWWAVGLRALPNALTNVFAATRPGSPAVLEGVNQRNNQNAAMFDQAFEDRSRRQDAEAAQHRQDMANAAAAQRQQAQDAESARRFNATQDRLNRGIEYQRDAAQAQTVRDAVRAQKQDAMDALKAKDINSRIAVRESREARRLTGKGPGGAAGTTEGMSLDEALASLDATYGGADKVPAAAKTQVKLAFKLPPKDRNKALISVLGQNTTGARVAGSQKRTADVKEIALFDKGREGAVQSLQILDRIDQSLAEQGVDRGHYQGQDIKGYGRFEQYVPNMLAGDKAQAMRQDVRDAATALVYDRTGKASTDAERREIQSILGAADSMDEAALIRALNFLRTTAQNRLKRVNALYPNAAAAFEANYEHDSSPGAEPSRSEPTAADEAEADSFLEGP